VKLSLGELYTAAGEHDNAIKLLAGIRATDDVTLGCRAYYALALWQKGMFDAALEVADEELRQTAGRDQETLRDLHYVRALAYEGKGQRAQARREMERLYAQDPGFRDVARRLQEPF
jgi:tetratricopeptide (TPR) repeat protein